jgi:hypothetical protein
VMTVARTHGRSVGGITIVPPSSPAFLATVITDPGGATFTASQFKPENSELGGDR